MSNIVLHYVWFKDHSCYQNTEINLSAKYHCEFIEQTLTVNVRKNPGYIDDFFGSNIDISAIVGENGTGKTTLLRFLFYLGSSDYNRVLPYIVVYECGEKMVCISNLDKNPKETDPDKLKKVETFNVPAGFTPDITLTSSIESPKPPLPLDQIRLIYFTEMFSPSQFQPPVSNENDLSFAAYLHDASINKHIKDINPVAQYIHNVFDQQMYFFANEENCFQAYEIRYPKYVRVSILRMPDYFVDMYVKRCWKGKSDAPLEEGEKKAWKLKEKFLRRENKTGIAGFKYHIACSMFEQIINEQVGILKKENQLQVIEQIINIADAGESYSAWDNLRKLLRNELIQSEPYDEFLNYIEGLINDPRVAENQLIRYMNTLLDSKQFVIPVRDKDIKKNDLHTTIAKFYSLYKQTVLMTDYLSFSWGLSSGEMLLLDLFSKLTHLLKKDDDGNFYLPDRRSPERPAKNALILLDEAEVAFHPEWQRRYLNAFKSFIRDRFVERGTHVQVVIATHSPIILSDIPKQNVVYLKRPEDKNSNRTVVVPNEECRETFGASIYALFNNSFFMEKGAIGAFASGYIEKIINTIRAYDTGENTEPSDSEQILRKDDGSLDLERADKIISLIGDDFVRQQLRQMYEKALKKQGSSKNHRLNELKQMRDIINRQIAELECRSERND